MPHRYFLIPIRVISQVKWVHPDMSMDGGVRNYSNIPLIRYAEVLLNYAEAKAELWNNDR